MDVSKLKSLIADQNAQRERHTLREAEGIIEQIASKQNAIVKIQGEIAELRTGLNQLEVEQLDEATILGGE